MFEKWTHKLRETFYNKMSNEANEASNGKIGVAQESPNSSCSWLEFRTFAYIVATLTGISLISGCGSRKDNNIQYVTKVVEVRVPVVQPCIKKSDIPQKMQQPPVKKGDSEFKKVRYLIIENNNSKVYEEKLEAIVEVCSE